MGAGLPQIPESKEPVNPQTIIEREEGVYKDAVNEAPIEDRFQEKVMPKAPDPRPFK
jgi:hypothetical protein